MMAIMLGNHGDDHGSCDILDDARALMVMMLVMMANVNDDSDDAADVFCRWHGVRLFMMMMMMMMARVMVVTATGMLATMSTMMVRLPLLTIRKTRMRPQALGTMLLLLLLPLSLLLLGSAPVVMIAMRTRW